jgi:hypothetical protein
VRTAIVVLGLSSLALGGCLSTNTKGSWSCKAPLGGVCQSIGEIDATPTRSGAAGTSMVPVTARTTIAGAEAVRWWKDAPMAAQGPGFPLREGDQVVRVVFAPFVDRSGDYYVRSEVYSVVRKGGWWAPSAAPPAFTHPAPYVRPEETTPPPVKASAPEKPCPSKCGAVEKAALPAATPAATASLAHAPAN